MTDDVCKRHRPRSENEQGHDNRNVDQRKLPDLDRGLELPNMHPDKRSIGGCGYPILLALPVNDGLAARYSSTPMPEKGNVLRFWMNLSKPIVQKMYAVLLLQTLFGTYLSSKQFDIYLKMLKIPDSVANVLHD